jgi:hypothetical protein
MISTKTLVSVLSGMVVFLLLVAAMSTQETTGGLQGTVRDPSGPAPGAK